MIVPALGLTQIQSSEAGAANVPLVSIAVKNPLARTASMKERFAAGKDDEASLEPRAQCRCNGVGKRLWTCKAAAAVSIAAGEISVAELAGRRCAILFAAAPQIAPGKTAEHGGAPGQRALALQCLEYLFDDETQATVP